MLCLIFAHLRAKNDPICIDYDYILREDFKPQLKFSLEIESWLICKDLIWSPPSTRPYVSLTAVQHCTNLQSEIN